MGTTCNQGIAIPDLSTDPCGGERIKAECVVDSNLYNDLGLSANATQQQINNALYLAFKNLKTIVDGL
jgi:hypothetical protein